MASYEAEWPEQQLDRIMLTEAGNIMCELSRLAELCKVKVDDDDLNHRFARWAAMHAVRDKTKKTKDINIQPIFDILIEECISFGMTNKENK